MQSQRLEIGDVVSYLYQLEHEFGNQPQVCNDFLDIVKESIDWPVLIHRASNLFRGHPELLVGLNTFIPPEYRIEVHPNEEVHVSIPGTNVAGGQGPTSFTIHPTGRPCATVHPVPQTNIGRGASPRASPVVRLPPVAHSQPHANSQNHHPPVAHNQPHANSQNHHPPVAHSQPHANSQNHHPPVAHSQPHANSQNQHPPVAHHHPPHSQSGRMLPGTGNGFQSCSPLPGYPVVDINHAIYFLNKVKNRFQGQPEIYGQFIEILSTFCADRQNLRNGVNTAKKCITEAEVYDQVARLFQDQEDLTLEFRLFGPGSNFE